MLIQVHYTNNSFDYVNEQALHRLIENGAITRFRRSSGWIKIGEEPIRQFQRNQQRELKEETKNIVRVAYDDKSYDYVTESELNTLIETNKIVKFKRITGWIILGVDPIRNSKRDHTFRYPSELKKLQIN